MKGLFCKDFIYLSTQKISVLLFSFLSLMFLFTDASMANFGIIFLPLMLSMLAGKSMVYDVMPPTSKYAFSMPFSKTAYICEKYLMVMLFPMLAGLLFSLLTMWVGHMDWETGVYPTLMSLLVILVGLGSVSIPLTVRFKDRGSIVLPVVFVVGFLGIFFFCQAFPRIAAQISHWALSINTGTILGAALGFSAICLVISVPISIALIKGEEF